MLYDRDIRESLFNYLEDHQEAFGGRIRILEEKTTGRARADAVMITPGEICGIEIKSDADSYARLPGQVKYYDDYYDRNLIVAGARHAGHVSEHVPPWWGILIAAREGTGTGFTLLREMAENPKVKEEKKITILWRPELNRLLERNRLPAYRGKSKKFVRELLLQRIPGEILWRQVSEELFERDYTTIGEEIEAYRAQKSGRRL